MVPSDKSAHLGPSVHAASRLGVMWSLAVVPVLLVALSGPAVVHGELPDGIPNVFDAQIRNDYQPYQVGNLAGNTDFPVVCFVAREGTSPAAVLVAVDARNGKGTWSLATDPVVLIAVFRDATTAPSVYLDTGFAQRGTASGSYTRVRDLDDDSLPKALKSVVNATAQVGM